MNRKYSRLYINTKIFSVFILKIIISFFPKKKKENNDINILVLSYFNLGDVICDIPSLRAIRAQWPSAKIHILMRRPSGIKMIAECPYVDSAEVITSDMDNWGTYITQLLRLKKMSFNMSFQLVRPFSQFRKTNIPYVIGVRHRYGLIDLKDEALYRHCFTSYAYVEGKCSRKEESMKVVMQCGINDINSETECWIPEQTNKRFKELQKPYVVIHPGASLEFKCWPIEKYGSVLKFRTG